ncbi:MAG: MotA/TolQ/ExbB proton channel family protein [Bacteroidota bacterium]|nr:MotA/TolQ/ExbB proton channel family protein [Bacteroidota bacterium]
MKKTLLVLVILGLIFSANFSIAQENDEKAPATEAESIEDDATTSEVDSPAVEVKEEAVEEEVEEAEEAEEAVPAKKNGTQIIKKYFIDGGGFMFPVLIALILGLAIAIEKIITLNMKSVNTKKLLHKIEDKLKNNDADGAQEICRNTKGSVASIFYQALFRRKGGVEDVEKAIVSYGSVQMGLLEKGLVWISLFISIAPMLGFMGTVIGMIEAFDKIEMIGDISPSIVAGGIKVALLTTVAGLVVAVILQLFYNYLVTKVDGIVNDMEDSSISLVDMMIEYDVTKK